MSLSDKIKIISEKLISDSSGWLLKVDDGKENNLSIRLRCMPISCINPCTANLLIN